MKTIKTVNGNRTIESWDHNQVPLIVSEILHEHRSALIVKLLTDLPAYLKFKLNQKLDKKTLEEVREALFVMRHSRIDIDYRYRPILEKVLMSDAVTLDSKIFYDEIDECIELAVAGKEKECEPGTTPVFNYTDMIINYRINLVAEIQTEAGLRKYVKDHYKTDITGQSKLLYILEDVREHFKKESKDYKWLLDLFRFHKLTQFDIGNEYLFHQELKPLLDRHFD